MNGKPKKPPRQKDLTHRLLAGDLDEDRIEHNQKFSNRNKHRQANKTAKTQADRNLAVADDDPNLLDGQVEQVYSLYCEVQSANVIYLCTTRKTLSKNSDTSIVVGDKVRIRLSGRNAQNGWPEGVIEHVLPRETVLTRSDSFKQQLQHPIVANARQMLIVIALLQPRIKWGLVDRMLVAAESGGLRPVVVLNKLDLVTDDPDSQEALAEATANLDHYRSMDISCIAASAITGQGLEEIRTQLENSWTVLAGHSGVGKSSLINALHPGLNIRVGEVSSMTEKGRHTTTSARRYHVNPTTGLIDTPGVKLFGLWNITPDNLQDFFPDVAAKTAPTWRLESYDRILASIS